MRLVLAAAIILAAPSLSWAQPNQPAPETMHDFQRYRQSLIACAYNDAGQYSGADSANVDERPGKPVQVGQGSQAWRLVIEAPDGNSCPRNIEVPQPR